MGGFLMNKIKRFLIGLLCAVSVSALALAFSACEDEKPSGGNGTIIGGLGGLGDGSSDDGDDNDDNDDNNQGGGNADDDNTDQGDDTDDNNNNDDNNGDNNDDGSQGDDTVIDGRIEFKTLTVDGTAVSCIVPNATTEFSFKNEIETYGNATYEVANDIYGLNTYLTKVVPLSTGDNVFYVFEMVGEELTTYTVTIRRKPMYTVSFQTNGGGNMDNQTVEEGAFATQPDDLTKAGYDFDGWDFNFSKPITADETVCAQWTAHTNTPYKVEYYLENLNDNGYTLHQTENLTGTTDEMATAEIKTYPHFTYDSGASSESGYILGDGTQVLRIYYDRNRYTVTLNRINNKGTVTGGGTYANAEEVTARATFNQGYSFDGWYNGNEKVSENVEYMFNPVSSVTLTAKWTANTDTPYKVEYYLENLNDNGFTLYETENLTGTTDETATAEIKEYTHFTYDRYNSNKKTSGTILGDGTQVLKVYYERNRYTLSSMGNGSITNAGEYKYGTEITSMATHNLGYEMGWYSDEEKISSEIEYVFTIEKDITAEFTVRGDMQAFNFTSTETTCTITGLADKTLTEIIIPDCVTDIGEDFGYDCYDVKHIVIGNSITTIADGLFGTCWNLETFTMGEAVTSISGGALFLCDNLTTITVAESNPSYKSIDGNLYTKDEKTLIKYAAGKKADTFIMPNSVTTIGKYAFSGCYNLSNIMIGTSVKTIGYYAFYWCYKLTDITIPDSVVWLEEGAFHDSGLREITIGKSVAWIGENAFTFCYKLAEINVVEDNANYKSIDGNLYNKSGQKLIFYATGKTADTFIMPNTVTTINDYAFAYCSNLTSVTIGNSVETIGNEAFVYCSKLTSITIPNSVTAIGNRAFCGCALTSVVFEDTTTWYVVNDKWDWQGKRNGGRTYIATSEDYALEQLLYDRSDSYYYKL
jgi:uncharacterized repeat protein (TIGR02543 family)